MEEYSVTSKSSACISETDRFIIWLKLPTAYSRLAYQRYISSVYMLFSVNIWSLFVEIVMAKKLFWVNNTTFPVKFTVSVN